MTDKITQMLEQAICDYLRWLKSVQYKGSEKERMRYEEILNDFALFVRNKRIAWKDTFSLDTLKAFRNDSKLSNISHAVRGLSYYLFSNGRVPQPLHVPNYQIDLPEIYEQYLLYHEQSRQVPYCRIKPIRRVLAEFHDYLQSSNIKLASITIEQIDAFMAQLHEHLSPGSCKTYRFHLRGFLSYLYHECKILPKDLAPLVVGAPLFAQAKPPKFLRPHELQRLFQSLKISSPTDLRTYAMIELAYSLGLRPKEISSITLDDISFSKRQLTLEDRKNNNPLTLPVPELTIKAMAAYLTKGRPKGQSRHLFLSFHSPYKPISSATVIHWISKALKAAGLRASAYWLRHTYAQNLLKTGASIYEIKEMLGHQNIQSTQRYLYIHIEVMRKVLFDEEL